MTGRSAFIGEWATPGDSPEGANLEFVRDLDALLAAAQAEQRAADEAIARRVQSAWESMAASATNIDEMHQRNGLAGIARAIADAIAARSKETK